MLKNINYQVNHFKVQNTKDVFPKECELWYADLGYDNNHLQHGIRPVLIHSNNQNNKYSPIVNIFALTSKVNKYLPVHVLIHSNKINGLKEDSMILIEQNITLDKSKLIKKIGVVDDIKMREVDEKICTQTPSLYRYIQSLLKN